MFCEKLFHDNQIFIKNIFICAKSSSQSVIYIQKKTTFVSPLSPSGGIGRARRSQKPMRLNSMPVRSASGTKNRVDN